MVEEQLRSPSLSRLPVWWQLALAYAALAMLGWLTIGMQKVFEWRAVLGRVAALAAQGDTDLAISGQNYAGSLVVDMLYAFGAAAIFGFAAVLLLRRSWNAWDYATITIGFAGVLSLIFLCARGRIMVFLPITMLPLLVLLYMPGVKTVMNVGEREQETPQPDRPATTLSREEIEREIAKERALIGQLGQNLDVFEVERSMDTDLFMMRYTQGLEEDSADNAEWFSIGRAVRRSHERIAVLMAQLEALPDQHR
jgi:hypothetical protein